MATYMYGIKETADMTRSFVWHNIRKPLFSLLPFWLVFAFLAAIDNADEPTLLALANLPLAYISILFAAHFHRAYMLNQEAGAITPWKPTRNDMRFIGVALIIFLLLGVLLIGMGGIGFVIGGKSAAAIAALISLPVFLYIALRLAFLYPDRATGGALSFKAAFAMSQGLVWRIFITPFVAGWKWLLGAALWTFSASMIAVMLAPQIIDENGASIPDVNSLLYKIINFTLAMPAEFFMGYYFTALTVTALSNYYLWAKNNPYRK